MGSFNGVVAEYPKQVTRKQVAEAAVAFCDALGLDAAKSFFPLHVSESEISFPAVVADEAGDKVVIWPLTEDGGGTTRVLSANVVIKVVD